MDTKEYLLQWFTNFLIKMLLVLQQINNYLMNKTNKSLKKIQNGKVYFSFMDDLCCNPADIELISVFC